MRLLAFPRESNTPAGGRLFSEWLQLGGVDTQGHKSLFVINAAFGGRLADRHAAGITPAIAAHQINQGF